MATSNPSSMPPSGMAPSSMSGPPNATTMAQSLPPWFFTDSRAGEARAVLIVCMVLSTVVPVLRLYTRVWVNKAGLWWDDYLVAAAGVCIPEPHRPLGTANGG